MRNTLALCALGLLLLGCTAAGALLEGTGMGQDFDLTKASQIQDGQTTKAEVLAAFGKPNGVSQTGSGEGWTYQFKLVHTGRQRTWGAGTLHPYTTRTETSVSYSKMLLVILDPAGIVQHHTVSETGTR